MKVLFIARNYPPHVGGMERLNYNLVRALDRLPDIQIEVVSNKFGKYSPIFHIYAIYKIIQKKPDIILLSDAYLSPIIPVIKKITEIPIVIIVHGLDITFPNSIYQRVIPRFVNMAHKIICVSKETKKECTKRGVLADKCKVINNGVELWHRGIKSNRQNSQKYFTDIQGKCILLSVGRLVKRKGIHWFVENVIPKLVEKDRNFVYVVVGDGPYRKIIEDIISTKNLDRYVRLVGKVSDEDLELLYNIADIFIMPNIPVKGDMEGFGIVILEASSHGIPVIASNLEGIKDAVVNEKTGVLVESLNAEMFAKEILKMMKTVKENRKIKKKIRRRVLEKYNWSKISQKYYSIFALLTK